MRVFHLTENLWFADDERIEAGGDAEQMAGRVEIREIVQMRRELAAIDGVEVAHECPEISPAPGDVVGHRVELRAIAGGEHGRFVGRPPGGQCPQGGLDASLKIDPLTQGDGRGAVTEAHDQNVHT